VGEKTTGREWLVIESSMKHAVFSPEDARQPRGYIPRDAAEHVIGRNMDGVQWFTAEESEAMRCHPEWRNEHPELPNQAPELGKLGHTAVDPDRDRGVEEEG
jgi:hypothetical protein